jgi:hypothetical protein
MHGGDITACSDGPGKGAEFTLSLPGCTPGDVQAAGRSEPALAEDHADAPAA